MGGGMQVARDIELSYTSLNEHLLHVSLRHAFRRRDYACVAAIVGMWALSWAFFAGLLFTFSLYACEFHVQRRDVRNQQEFLLSWGWSIFQRFLLNEPAGILLGRGVPKLL